MGKVEIMEGFPEEAAQEQSLAVREGMATGLIHEPKAAEMSVRGAWLSEFACPL